ncbi:MAG: hypothetical protein LBP92_02305 [Deltaproteobacteria bacterium]|nr:hypothetical protein [Deltaproteobacteria bacterium]
MNYNCPEPGQRTAISHVGQAALSQFKTHSPGPKRLTTITPQRPSGRFEDDG